SERMRGRGQRERMAEVHPELVVWRNQRCRDDRDGDEHEEGTGDHSQRSPRVLAQQPEARRSIIDVAHRELDDVRIGGYGSRTFGLRMVMAMSTRTLTTTTMSVK